MCCFKWTFTQYLLSTHATAKVQRWNRFDAAEFLCNLHQPFTQGLHNTWRILKLNIQDLLFDAYCVHQALHAWLILNPSKQWDRLYQNMTQKWGQSLHKARWNWISAPSPQHQPHSHTPSPSFALRRLKRWLLHLFWSNLVVIPSGGMCRK